MYAAGDGVLQDIVQAHAWYNVSSANGGGELSQNNRDLLAIGMTPEQLAKAKKLAAEYFEKYKAK